jgi:hypothetical protein
VRLVERVVGERLEDVPQGDQEQVMAVAQKVADYTLGQADLLRRAMGKKKKSELGTRPGSAP